MGVLTIGAARPARAGACIGDCDLNGRVSVDEVVSALNTALGRTSIDACSEGGFGDEVTIDELVQTVKNALTLCGTVTLPPGPARTGTLPPPLTQTPTPTPPPEICGDDFTNTAVGEECDDGGRCVQDTFCAGGDKDGTTCTTDDDCPRGECRGAECTSTAQCPSGVCRPVGGDGCAANCTVETRRFARYSDETFAQVQIAGLQIPLTLRGTRVLTTGRPRGTEVRGPGNALITRPMEVPIVIKAADVKFEPVPVFGSICACVRGVAHGGFGPGNSGTGLMGCTAEGLLDINVRMLQDHNTTPGDSNNSGPANGLADDPECDDVEVVEHPKIEFGARIVATACREGSGTACSDARFRHHPPGYPTAVCNGPRVIEFYGGPAGRGSMLLLNNTAIGQLANAGKANPCIGERNQDDTCSPPEFGRDCQPCTEDDLDLGIASAAPLTSGTAEAGVFDVNNGESGKGLKIADGETCGGAPCAVKLSGSPNPSNCDVLDDPEASLPGALVSAFTAIHAKTINDNVTILRLDSD